MLQNFKATCAQLNMRLVVGNTQKCGIQSCRFLKQRTSNNVASTASSGIRSLLVGARSSHPGHLLQRVGQQGGEGAGGGGGQVQGQADQGVKERLYRTFLGPFLQVD